MSKSIKESAIIDAFERVFKRLSESFDGSSKFSKGDFLLLKIAPAYASSKPKYETNGYGVLKKYVVVHVDRFGSPWIKEIDKNGNPIGVIKSVIFEECHEIINHFMNRGSFDYLYNAPALDCDYLTYEIDPEYMDSMLLGPSYYDPTSKHKQCSKLWKEISKHNKKHKMDTSSLTKIVDIFNKTVVGDQYWTSAKKYFTVVSKTVQSTRRSHTVVKGPYVPILNIAYANGKTRQLFPDDLLCKALYNAKPRTYKEVLDPIV